MAEHVTGLSESRRDQVVAGVLSVVRSSRTHLHTIDRAFWLVLSRVWSRWADVLVVVKPDTVLRWHRAGFRLFRRWKSRSGCPSDGGVSPETRHLIRQMAEGKPQTR
jgi:putative transposase